VPFLLSCRSVFGFYKLHTIRFAPATLHFEQRFFIDDDTFITVAPSKMAAGWHSQSINPAFNNIVQALDLTGRSCLIRGAGF
jgi:hypothetical protein